MNERKVISTKEASKYVQLKESNYDFEKMLPERPYFTVFSRLFILFRVAKL